MKGKIAFVLGAAVGYVLGTRAGRERYEQIKRGAQTVWNTEPVQKGVGIVKGAIDDRADEVKSFIRRASSDAFAKFAQQTAPKPQPTSKPANPGGAAQSGASRRSSAQAEEIDESVSPASGKASE